MGHPISLLVVEDVPDDAELMILALQRDGLDVTWERVETADELKAALATGAWDAVVSDYTLPEFGATAALKVVREADPDMPFLVVSGTVGEEVAVGMMQIGASDYVLKHNLTRLAAAIKREVREAANRRASRRAEQEVSRLAAIVDSSDDAIISKTLDGIVTSWNPGAKRLHGWTAEEAIGRHISFIVPPDKADEFEGVMKRLRLGERFKHFETVRLHKDGTRRDVSITLSPIRDRYGRLCGASKVARDISERKQAEESLREKEAKLAEAVRIARLGYWSHDLATGNLDWSDLLYDIFGVCPVAFGQTFNVFLAILHPHDMQRVKERIAEAVTAVGSFDHTYRILIRGEVRVIHEIGRVIATEDGRPYRVTGTAQDVTERKQAEDAVRTSEERLRTLVAATSAIIWDTPASGKFETAQPGWMAFSGQTFDQLRGWGWLNAVHLDDQENTARVWTAALTTRGVYQVEHRLRRADGVYRQMSVQAAPILDPNGAIREWVGVHTDVTARRQAEESLHLRDRAIQAATQGLMITDPNETDNPVIYVSPGFERITGYGPEEVLGHNCRFLHGKDTDPAAIARLREAIRAAEPITIELLNYRKDGTTFWNELSISPVRDAAGRLTHFVGVQADVTARRILEEQFRQVQKMEAVGQLAGGVAHDFNNLLTIINGYSDLLLQSLSPGDPSRELVTEIHTAGVRSAGLTRQLLAFSRQQVLAPRVLDLNEVVTDTEKMLRRLIGEDVQLTTTPEPELWKVRADPGQVEQVLMNLAVNARDAMPRGGRLTIETQNIELEETYVRTNPNARTGAHVLMSVTDSGSGIPPEVKARIFEPFFTTKGPGKGTGLGLATVYGIVKQSGGHVAVYSEVGVGTTFKVYLPRSEQVADRPKPRSQLLAPPLGTETVLVAEDEDGVRALTRHVLASCGYTVLEAADGDEAIRVAAKHDGPIHLLITDVVMPGAGGRAIAEQMAESHPGMQVLFVSGYTDDAVIRHGVLQEGVNFLQKPFSPFALAHTIREILDQAKAG